MALAQLSGDTLVPLEECSSFCFRTEDISVLVSGKLEAQHPQERPQESCEGVTYWQSINTHGSGVACGGCQAVTVLIELRETFVDYQQSLGWIEVGSR